MIRDTAALTFKFRMDIKSSSGKLVHSKSKKIKCEDFTTDYKSHDEGDCARHDEATKECLLEIE